MKKQRDKLKRKTVVNIILIMAILSIFICIIIEKSADDNIIEEIYNTQKLNFKAENNINQTEKSSTEDEQNIMKVNIEETNKNEEENAIKEDKTNTTKEENYPQENIVDTYKGYDVCAKLEIPSISLETNVLTNYSTKALKVSVTKFWGVNPNEIGNFCIAGHNFKNNNMFSNLKKLKNGDKFYIIDRKIGKVEYEIFKIYKVLPNDVSCLDSITNNEREVTLITCTSDSKKRIIVKAKEFKS